MIIDSQLQFEIKRIIEEHEEDSRIYLQIKWREYDDLTFPPFNIIAQDTAELVKAFMAKKLHGRLCKK